MTDDFSRELEEIAKIFSTNPRGLSELRELIASLPSPSPLTLPGASETSLPSTETQVNDLSSGPASSAGVAGTTGASSPGSISGGSILPGTLQANAFASSVRPIQMVEGPDLPTLTDPNFPDGSVIFNQDDGRFYRNYLDVWHTFSPETDRSNGLPDSAFESCLFAYVAPTAGYDGQWSTQQEIVSGTPDNGVLDDVYQRYEISNNPFNSAIVELDTGHSAGAYDQTCWVRSDPYQMLGTYMSELPYVVAAIQVMDWGFWGTTGGVVEADYTAAEFYLQIYSLLYDPPRPDALIVEAETVVDVKTLPADLPVQVWISCYRDPDKLYGLRFGFRAAKNATAVSSGRLVALGEPQLHLAATPDSAMYTPAVGSWIPSALQAYGGNVLPRTTVDLYGLKFAPEVADRQVAGAYGDWRLFRWNTKTARMDDGGGGDVTLDVLGTVKASLGFKGGGSNGPALYVGDDAIIADIDVGNTLQIKGQQDPTQAAIVLGSNKDVRLYRDGYRTLHVDNLDGYFVRLTGALAGWCKNAYPPGFDATGSYGTVHTLAAGSTNVVVVEIQVPAKMMLRSVSIWNTDASGDRGFSWGVYAQPWGNESQYLTLLCFSGSDMGWTASAASKRTIKTSGGPVFLPPGTYWLAIWNAHNSNTLGIGSAASGTLSTTRARGKSGVSTFSQPIDFLTATWTDYASVLAVMLDGDTAPSADQFVRLDLVDGVRAAYAPWVSHKIQTVTVYWYASSSRKAYPLTVEHA